MQEKIDAFVSLAQLSGTLLEGAPSLSLRSLERQGGDFDIRYKGTDRKTLISWAFVSEGLNEQGALRKQHLRLSFACDDTHLADSYGDKTMSPWVIIP
jgi:hypothetical protein